MKGDSLSEAFFCDDTYDDLVKKTLGANSKNFDIKASRGWFEKLTKRSGIHCALRHGEAAISNKKEAEKLKKIQLLHKSRRFRPTTVHNSCSSTTVFVDTTNTQPSLMETKQV